MRENFSVQGNIKQWMQISKAAFRDIGATSIVQDPRYARISAKLQDGRHIILNIRRKGDDRLLMEFDASDSELIGTFKSAAASLYRQAARAARTASSSAKEAAVQAARDRKLAQETALAAQQALAARARAEQAQEAARQNAARQTAPETGTSAGSGQYPDHVDQNGHADYTPDSQPADDDSMSFTQAYTPDEYDFIEETQYIPEVDAASDRTSRSGQSGDESTDSLVTKFNHYGNKMWLIWLMLFVLPPLGLFMLWYFKRQKLVPRIITTVVMFLYMLLIWVSFFGVDTGLNKTTIQQWYNNIQYSITRSTGGGSTSESTVTPTEKTDTTSTTTAASATTTDTSSTAASSSGSSDSSTSGASGFNLDLSGLENLTNIDLSQYGVDLSSLSGLFGNSQ
ncbi:MAG: hypothetical protein ACOYB8_07855 [Eubacteriaceae bacterium]